MIRLLEHTVLNSELKFVDAYIICPSNQKSNLNKLNHRKIKAKIKRI